MIGQLVSEIFTSESVNGHKDGHRLKSHPISSSRAYGSGELKIKYKKETGISISRGLLTLYQPNRTKIAKFFVC